MAKRFADTKLSRAMWYRLLPPAKKCAVRFLFDECDEAGLWEIDMEAVAFFVGEEVDLNELMIAVNKDKVRLKFIGRDKVWITDFCKFQYGELSPGCKPHQKIISILKKNNLFDEYLKGLPNPIDEVPIGLPNPLEEIPYPLQRVQEKEKEKEMEKETEKEKGGVGGKTIKPSGSEEIQMCKNTWLGTLHALGSPRDFLTIQEETEIARAIRQESCKTVELALFGARFEVAMEGFDPKSHIDITRILLKDKQGKPRMQKFVDLGAKARARVKNTQVEQIRKAEEEPEWADPENTRANIQKIMALAGFPKRDSELSA